MVVQASVTVHPQQVAIHTLAEAAGLLVMVPFLIYASKSLPTERARNAAWGMAAGALVVDGLLLARYLSGTTHKPIL